jgi:protein gp37
MSLKTNIQWCHGTVNPIMGCGGCELFLSPREIIAEIDKAIACYGSTSHFSIRGVIRELVKEAYEGIDHPFPGHSDAMSTTNIWHVRHDLIEVIRETHGRSVADRVALVINQAVSCYAARLHLNKGKSIVNPTRGANPGYAPVFESVTNFQGRVWEMARSRDLCGTDDPNKPWLDGCPRLIFVSDMGDAFSRESDFTFLEEEVIAPIRSPEGQRHFWLWLTKRPDRMARFGVRIGGFPRNVCAMTTVTGPEKLHRVDQLREVRASVRGLSLEPLWERIPSEILNLDGISWLICGGESGRRDAVRPFHLKWARELRDYCHDLGVAFFLKQLGRRPFEDGIEFHLRDGHGGDWSEWPVDLRVREMPPVFKAHRR